MSEQNFFKTKSFGIVVQMSEIMYDESPIKNASFHIPFSKEEILLGLLKKFYEEKIGSNNIVSEVIIGHEHGNERAKCHMQIFISFETQIRKVIMPGEFYINGTVLLFIAQHCKSPKKLREYCKKGGDFMACFPCRKLKDILKDGGILDEKIDVDDPYDYMLKRSDLDENDVKNIFANCDVTEYKKNFMSNSKRIMETYNKFVKKEDVNLEFKWIFPDHMLKYIFDSNSEIDFKFKTFSCLYDWFCKYCNIECVDVKRRKALFLFSIRGGMGKSFFARGLVPEICIGDSPYYVYCRGTLDAAEFLKKSKTAKLVILDDINYINSDIEIWKALAVGEPTNIRSPYHNIAWSKSLPCVLLSNNLKTFKYWMETEDLKSRCIFVSVNFFIGPPDKDNNEYHSFDYMLSEDVENALGIK
jgi:hypothetical protein